ncbi:MAG: AtpZ/AtpI family protein [Pseudoalteromonas prydzensis]|uniref:AtpZ/AtpI family protein n=1 Tax=Pseudoalteromonas prydzensis TaxID=182141 RepID=UPI003F99FCF3
MNERKLKTATKAKPTLATKVGIKATRKLKARSHSQQRVWFGLGMMGLIGWSVAIPTLVGASIGVYVDGHYPSERSWTLALLVAGLALGCFNAWHWIEKEDLAIGEDHKVTAEKEHNDE